MKIIRVLGFLAAATLAFGISANSAKAVTYTLTGTAIDSPEAAMGFSFVFTSPAFITTVLEHVTLDSCSTTSTAYACTVASFRPAELKNFPNSGDTWDQVDFEWTNTANTGGGGGQLLFVLGAFTTPGVYNVGPISMSSDAVLTVSETPLPASLPLFVTGLGALGLLGWRRKRKNAAAIAA